MRGAATVKVVSVLSILAAAVNEYFRTVTPDKRSRLGVAVPNLRTKMTLRAAGMKIVLARRRTVYLYWRITFVLIRFEHIVANAANHVFR